MDDRIRQSLLYDFYGELLNEHQKQVFSAAIFDDMSYSELADEFGCSRQAAFDLIRRINKKLEGYETKLGLLNRFTAAKDKMNELSSKVEAVQAIIEQSGIEIENKNNLKKQMDDIKITSSEIFDTF